MKIKKFFAGSTVLFVGMLVIAGCATAPAPTKPAEEVLKDGISNMSKLTSYKYDVAVKADMTDESDLKVKFNVKLDGAVEVKDMKDPKISVKMDGSVDDGEGMSGSMKAELMMNKEAVYVNLNSLNISEEGLLPEDIKTYLGKWWMYPMSSEILDELAAGLETEDFDPKQLNEMLGDKVPEYVGTDSIAGDPSWHYSLKLDKKAIMELAGETDAPFKDAVANVDVWVSSTTSIMNQMKMDIKVDGDKGQARGTASFVLTLADINKPVTLNIPTGAEAFPAEELIGSVMMLMGGGIDDYDDYDYSDDDGMYDENGMYIGDEIDFSMYEGGAYDETDLEDVTDEEEEVPVG